MKTLRFPRILSATVLGIAASVVVSSCGPSKPVLHVFNWSDYLSEDVLKAFEEKYDCRIEQDIFNSNEILEAKLKAGASDYDIVVPSSYVAGKMFAQGMLLPLDPEKIAPTLENLDPIVTAKLPEGALSYCVPYMMSYTGIAYLKSKVTDFEPSWKMLGNQNLHKRISLLNDYREVIGSALKCLGYSANTTNEDELRQAGELVMKWKENAAKFDNEQYKQGINNGEFYLVQGYVGDLLQVQEENDDIEIVIPTEGTQLSIDMLAIPAGSKNVELAYAFINFVHEPENAARNTEAVMYLCPNEASYDHLSDEIMGNRIVFPLKETLMKSELLLDLGDSQVSYMRLWENIKGKDSLDD